MAGVKKIDENLFRSAIKIILDVGLKGERSLQRLRDFLDKNEFKCIDSAIFIREQATAYLILDRDTADEQRLIEKLNKVFANHAIVYIKGSVSIEILH